jgi:Xaa-Pro aminopeptidase
MSIEAALPSTGSGPNAAAYPMTSPVERERRHMALRTAMADASLDALVIAVRGDGFTRGRLHFVSDVHFWAGRMLAILPLRADPVVIGEPLMGISRALLPGWITDCRLSATPGTEAAAVLREKGLENANVGIVGLDTVMAVEDLRGIEAGLPRATISDATALFDGVRAIKSTEEVGRLRATSRVLKEAMRAIETALEPGVTERYAVAVAHATVRAYGCLDGIAILGHAPFTTMGPGSPYAFTADDVISVDLEWQGPEGYWLELRRVFSFKPPTDRQRRFWEMVVETHQRCREAMIPGVPSDAILAVQNAVYRRYGFEDARLITYAAHGIGLDCLEPPWVPGKGLVLQEGVVLSLHPHVRFHDREEAMALGGIGIADNVLVTAVGGERLTDEADEWIVV